MVHNQWGQLLGEPVANWAPRLRPTARIMQGSYVSLELLESSMIHSMSKTDLEILYNEIPKLES